ncbi:SpoIIE family protein phosphatase [Conexibacter sp. SYSU D00693]|uniref:SpoIIE family protein phosphatase n=1 Tax=Conexibacter sp. SYSU D00693 TaxID=2812560 RepID=UPI00196A7B8D|nr:SpoIIE family protein phosphatase [Conexibacter sp. SYSU D00693]
MADAGTFTFVTRPSGELMVDLPSWRAVTGQSRDEIRDFGWQEALHPEDRERVAEEWATAVHDVSLFVTTYRISEVGGGWRRLRVVGLPVRGREGEVERFEGVAQDVTESELDSALLQAVIHEAPVGLALTWGPDHVFRLHNEAYRDLLPPDREVVGLPVREALVEIAEITGAFDEVQRTGQTLRFDDFSVPWSTGPERFYRFSLAPVDGPDGIGGVLISGVETTDEVVRRRSLERELAEERAVAETLQRGLLPSAPQLPGLRADVRYLPGGPEVQIGGDWYDAFRLPCGRTALVVGDIAGRGAHAARLMSQVRAAVRAYAIDGHGPTGVLDRVERFFAGQDLAEMATLFYAELEEDLRGMRSVCAGHPPPVLAVAGAPSTLVRGAVGPPVGAGAPVGSALETALPPEALLLLYTDGLVEDRGRPLDVGLQRLLDVTAGAVADGPAAVCDAALADLLAAPGRHDDVALLAVQADAGP